MQKAEKINKPQLPDARGKVKNANIYNFLKAMVKCKAVQVFCKKSKMLNTNCKTWQFLDTLLTIIMMPE